jgi:acyl-CoA reductase-like NAD-dependent aldehyde dehydrogenase
LKTFQATFEVEAAIEWMRGMAQLRLPEELIEDTEERIITTRYFPLGVVGAIVPWNYPILLAAAKMSVLSYPFLAQNNC